MVRWRHRGDAATGRLAGVRAGGLALGLGALLGAAACTLPVGAIVEPEFPRLLRAPAAFRSEVDRARIDAEGRRRFGVAVGRVQAANRLVHRYQPHPAGGGYPGEAGTQSPLAPCALDRPGAATAGLSSGDILLAKNEKSQSLGTTLSLEPFTYYDHCAVLAREEGRLWVYESWPRIRFLGPAPSFAARLEGEVARVPLSRFVARYQTVEVVRLQDEERNRRLVPAAHATLGRGIRFDPFHDPTDEALSCVEYVEHLLAEAGYAMEFRREPVSTNASIRVMLAALGFHTDGYFAPDRLAELEGARCVAWFSHLPSAAQVRATHAVYRVLHARFGPETSLGDYLGFDRWNLTRLRPPVRAFLEWSLGFAEARPDLAPDELARALEEMLPLFLRPHAAG